MAQYLSKHVWLPSSNKLLKNKVVIILITANISMIVGPELNWQKA